MAIVIKQDQINLLIYKYLLEAGLQHSAYSLYNEAKIEQIYRNYENDLKAGHLIHHLERSLIFNQIESHIYFSQYCECKQPMELIKQHQCDVVQKKREIKQEIEKEREGMSLDTIGRVEGQIGTQGGIYQSNGQIHFPELDQNFLLENLCHIKIDKAQEFEIFDWNPQTSMLHLYEEKHNWIKIISYNPQSQNNHLVFQTVQIFPCVIGELLKKPKFISWESTSYSFMVIVYEDGFIQILDKNYNQINIFQIDQIDSLRALKWNPDYYNVLCLEFSEGFEIIDIPSLESIKSVTENVLQFEWVYVQKYVYLNSNFMIYLCSLTESAPLHQIQADPGTCSFSLNHNSSLIATFSQQENSVKIWTFNETQHALEFLDENDIKFYTWSKANADGQGCIMTLITEKSIKIWDVEFGEIKYSYELKETIMEYSILQGSKNQDLLILFTEDQDKYKIWIFDQNNKNRREITLNSHMESILKLDEEEMLVLLDDELMVLNIKKIENQYVNESFPPFA
ncbi:LisH protein (macronuclear) [Tetrahymena thermophila SB210]|uniref:LisH protein n=1 Tax=Tetrahymena thermophila (strain SB210) TaxID=312017 RepID=Q23DQ6_TETTS|nr:LisH protein [Tetrahymena thermophila SB210]EAR94699.2 LisH protein [Tetrahymena thermophila SB210]|eukprot:XP_001014630.2 LisH protein [Tetrahymena thermophila SB210]